MFTARFHQAIYTICLLAVAFFMPVSVWMLSLFSVAGAINWLLSGHFRTKVKTISGRPGVFLLLLLFGMYLVWLANTSDTSGAIHELKLQLPLLLFPLVIGSSGLVEEERLNQIFLAFTSGAVVAVGAGYLALAGLWPVEVTDSRQLALFVPSIRLSVMLNFAVFVSLWMAGRDEGVPKGVKLALVATAAVISFFLFRLMAVTGILLFIILLGGTGIWLVYRKRVLTGTMFILLSATVLSVSALLLYQEWSRMKTPGNEEVNIPHQVTASGNRYSMYPEETLRERGYLVWNNVCEEELRKEWSERSGLRYDTTDRQGNELRVTLIRYLSFLGMTKDSSAVASLTGQDIRNIENGFANPLYARPGNPRGKAYELVWQLDRKLNGANPSGHSVTQRLEFYRAAWGIIRKNPVAGVGTGDIREAFAAEYLADGSPLGKEFRMRSHNQYLAFAVTFGVPGMLCALVLIILPWWRSNFRYYYPFAMFIALIFMSMFNDDTFASFTGATFFSYFYTLFLMLKTKDEFTN